MQERHDSAGYYAGDLFEGYEIGSAISREQLLLHLVCAIAKNHRLNLCKAGNREMPLTAPVSHEAATGSTLEEKLIEKDTAMQIHGILHNLQEPYKEVFSLRVFGQLSFQEIAHLFGKTESWARVTYHRARKRISNLECDIVCDLLPLYHDGIVSEATKAAVEQHVSECEKCRGELKLL